MENLEMELTNIYKELFLNAQGLALGLNHRIYDFELVLHFTSLMQYEDEEEKDVCYPIPVVQIGKLCDVEYWLDKIILTTKIRINDLLSLDLNKLSMYNYELYGCKSYPYMFYKKEDGMNILMEKLDELLKEREKEIGIQIYFPKDTNRDYIYKCINKIRNLDVFYYSKGR